MEKAERDGNIKISTMEKIADALDMDFVYGFVPRTSLNEMVRQQAKKIALHKMERLDNTMRLELQELSSEEKERALKDMIDRILIDGPKDFWKK
jgi:predicted DNA-binding mobile mystery protein A